MPADIRVGLRLTADAKGLVGEVRASRGQIEQLTRAMGRGEPAARSFARATAEVERSTRRTGRSLLAAHGALLRYATGFLSIAGAVSATRGVLRYADAHTQVANAVRIGTRTAAEFTAVQQGLFDVAHRTRAPIAAIADLYQKLSIAQDDLGATSGELLAVIEGVGQSLVISGTSAAEARGALLQLSQALSGTVVRAEEFNSLIEGAPALLRAVASNLDRAGGSVGRLRQLVIEGEVSSREFFEALQRGLPELERGFASATGTVAQGLIQVDNAMTRLIGRIDETNGVSEDLAESLKAFAEALGAVDPRAVAEAMDVLSTAVLLAAGALGGRLVFAAGRTVVAATAARREILRLGVAAGAMADRSRTAVTALYALNRAAGAARIGLALLGGPAGAIGLAIAGLALFATRSTDAEEAAERVTRALGDQRLAAEKLAGVLNDLTDAALRGLIADIDEALYTPATFLTAGGFLAQRDALDREIDSLRRQRRETEEHSFIPGTAIGSRTPDELRIEIDQKIRDLEILDQRIKRDERRRAEAQARLIRRAEPQGGALFPPADPAAPDTGADPREAERRAERGAAAIEAIHRRHQDALVRLTHDRIGQVRHAERRALAELEKLRGQDGVSAAEFEAARTAIQEHFAAERQAIREEEHRPERAAEQARLDAERAAAERVQELHRAASREIAFHLASPYGQAVLEIEEWAEQQRAALEAAGANQIEFDALALAAQIQINNARDAENEQFEQEQAERRARRREEELLAAAGFRDREAAEEAAHQARIATIQSRGAAKVREIRVALARFEEQTGTARVQTGLEIAEASLRSYAAFSTKAFRLAQVAGIARATVSTAQGVAASLAKGFPLGPIEAALIAAAGAAEIATIRAQRPPRAFQRGGIVDSPTYFTARGVPRGVAGEAGPEAILPLRRGPDGRLGVEARGAQGAPVLTIAPTITVHVDADPDRRPDETGAEIARRVQDELVPVIRATLADELRPGGLLRPTDRAA